MFWLLLTGTQQTLPILAGKPLSSAPGFCGSGILRAWSGGLVSAPRRLGSLLGRLCARSDLLLHLLPLASRVTSAAATLAFVLFLQHTRQDPASQLPTCFSFCLDPLHQMATGLGHPLSQVAFSAGLSLASLCQTVIPSRCSLTLSRHFANFIYQPLIYYIINLLHYTFILCCLPSWECKLHDGKCILSVLFTAVSPKPKLQSGIS